MRSKKKKKANLKRERERSHKVTSNASIMTSQDIIPGIATQNRNKIEEPERKPKPQIRKENPNRKSIREKSEMRPEKTQKRKLSSE
jgi:hypothetical protein